MSLAASGGMRYVVCHKCGAHGPKSEKAGVARGAARAAGWSRTYPRGRGEDFTCPSCRPTK